MKIKLGRKTNILGRDLKKLGKEALKRMQEIEEYNKCNEELDEARKFLATEYDIPIERIDHLLNSVWAVKETKYEMKMRQMPASEMDRIIKIQERKVELFQPIKLKVLIEHFESKGYGVK